MRPSMRSMHPTASWPADPRRRAAQAVPGPAKITAWVKAHFSGKTVGGTTVYDLTTPS